MATLLQKCFIYFQTIFLLTSCYISRRRKAISKIANPTFKGLSIKAGTALRCVSFELIHVLSHGVNTITPLHQDMDVSSAMCSLSMSACPINHMLGLVPDIAHSRTYQSLYNHTHNHMTTLLVRKYHHHKYQNNTHSNEFIDNQLELMMKDYYSHNQDKISRAQIRELKVKTFPYLSDDDVKLSMSDRNIIRKALVLDTDYVLSVTDKHSIHDFVQSMREYLSTHDNPSVQNKSYVSLKLVNHKPFYIKPYLTHESEIRFAQAEIFRWVSYIGVQ